MIMGFCIRNSDMPNWDQRQPIPMPYIIRRELLHMKYRFKP